MPQAGWVIEYGSFHAEYDDQNRIVSLTDKYHATDRDYEDTVYLRGIHHPERWDPHTGSTLRLSAHYVRYRDEVYTRTSLYVTAEHAVFLISRPNPKHTARITARAPFLRDVTAEINMMENTWQK